VVLLAAWALLLIRLSAPWYGVQDAYQVWVASGARNYERYGLDVTGLALVIDYDSSSPESLSYYHHHPPLIIWLPALLGLVAGDAEVVVRYVFAAATLLSVAAMYALARRLFDPAIALWATLFYALVPFTAYYGRVPGHDQLAMAGVLVMAVVFYDWLRRPTRGRLIALMLLALLAVWTAWSAVFFVAAFGLVAFVVGSWQQRAQVVALGIFTLLALIALILFYQWMWPGTIDDLLQVFVWRTSSVTANEGSRAFTWGEWLARIFLQIVLMLTPGVLILSAVGLVMLRNKLTRAGAAVMVALFIGGAAYQLMFRNASYIHEYYKLILTPAFALCAGFAWVELRRRGTRLWVARAFTIVMLALAVIWGAGVMVIWHGLGSQPPIHAIIAALDGRFSPQTVVLVTINPDDYAIGDEYGGVISFYTGLDVRWGVPPDAMLDTPAAAYVYCGIELPAALTGYASEAVYGDFCQMYRLNLSG
jgi:4-amino-4-deoxy-L-arabinose transferase-like glycosyltransferase